MPVGFTFGSVGDIISLCIIIKDLVKALDESKGASAEYQEIVRELWALDRVLLEVELLWRTSEETIELNALRVTAHRIVDQCRHSIENFLAKIQKYGKPLRDGGSGNRVRDAAMKVHWQVAQSSEVTKFRAEISAHCSAISMLLVTASVNQAQITDQKREHEYNTNAASLKAQTSILKDVRSRLIEVSRQTESANSKTTNILEAVKLDWLRQLGHDMRNFMRKIFLTNIAIYRAVLDIRGRLPSHLERSLDQEPFILEDGIGRIAPVHMQFISSWEAFDSVLELRFRGMQGYGMVQEKKYVMQENATKREIDRTRAWECSFLPGQKIVMSMVFDDVTGYRTSCPRCQTPTEEPQDSEIQCAGCAMWYRRIVEYNDVDPLQRMTELSGRKPQRAQVQFGESPFEHFVFGPEEPASIKAGVPSKKRRREDVDTDELTLFKRVRILSKKTRLKKSQMGVSPFSRYVKADALKEYRVFRSFQGAMEKTGYSFSNAYTGLPSNGLDDLIDSDSTNDSDHSDVLDGLRESNGLEESDGLIESHDVETLAEKAHENEKPTIASKDQAPPQAADPAFVAAAAAAVEGNTEALETYLSSALDKAEWGTQESTQSKLKGEFETIIKGGHLELVQTFIDKLPRFLADAVYMRRVTQIAAEHGHIEILRFILHHDLNATDWTQDTTPGDITTPLHLAASRGQVAAVRLLLEHGADVESKDERGQTPLYHARANGRHAVAELLLHRALANGRQAVAELLEIAKQKGMTAISEC